LEFWALLGRVFVHNGYFLRDAWFVIELLKPLVHHKVMSRTFRQEFLGDATDVSCDDMLELLQNESVLDHRLLPKLKAWSLSSREAQSSMLKFFQETFMISDIRGRDSGQGGGDRGSMSLVTARLFDCSDRARQQRVEALADDTSACSMFHAVYALHSAHVGIIAHMMATVQKLQPKKIALDVHCAQNHVCMQRGPSRCAVSTRPLPDVFASKLGSLQERLPSGQYYHALVISSNDDGLFAFAARCADSIMRSGAFGILIWDVNRSSFSLLKIPDE
jgi:hypothetical protein